MQYLRDKSSMDMASHEVEKRMIDHDACREELEHASNFIIRLVAKAEPEKWSPNFVPCYACTQKFLKEMDKR